MPRFEKRIADEQIAKARERLAEGASVRTAAAEIGCAPSTLSYRVDQLKRAESAPEPVEDVPLQPVGASARPLGTEEVGPLETLREAMRATKDGEPHWPTRIAAARAIASLRPQELEPKPVQRESEFVVYDLPPGTPAVVHRAIADLEDKASSAESATAPSGESQPVMHWFWYEPTDGSSASEAIGNWTPPHAGAAVVKFRMHSTDDRATADRWRSELAAGRPPQEHAS